MVQCRQCLIHQLFVAEMKPSVAEKPAKSSVPGQEAPSQMPSTTLLVTPVLVEGEPGMAAL